MEWEGEGISVNDRRGHVISLIAWSIVASLAVGQLDINYLPLDNWDSWKILKYGLNIR